MKVYKITFIVCFICSIVFCFLTIIMQCWSPLLAGITSNIFTGFIVSSVISIIGYFYEKTKILTKINNNISSLYINMEVIKSITGSKLCNISNTLELSKLYFNNIASFTDLSISFIDDMDIDLYDGFCRKSRLVNICKELKKYKNSLLNLKNIAAEIELFAVGNHDYLYLQLEIKRAQRLFVNPNEYELLKENKNSVLIRTAKLHEYEASLIIELEKILKEYFEQRKIKWEDKKLELQREAESICKQRGNCFI